MSDTQEVKNDTLEGNAATPVKAEAKPEPLTKADITKSWFSWWCIAEMSNSFERLQAVAFCAAMLPIFKKLYKTPQSLSAALTRHMVFFNTQATWGSIIPGLTIAMEEQKAKGEDVPDEAITSIKTGLMGPFAGIGDTVDWGIVKPIILGLFIPVAMAGNWLGSLLPCVIFVAITLTISYMLWHKGYSLGRESITAVLASGWINKLITGAGVLGLFMMGSLSASFVKLATPLKITTGGNNIAVQSLIDKTIPGLLPLLVVFGIYGYLTVRGPKFVKILVILLVGSIITSVLGIF